eukprot:m.204015 g.204015  ORF g.204015 m.204015 type:complete len:61 (+) comp32873_c1_seq1:61-243(+)
MAVVSGLEEDTSGKVMCLCGVEVVIVFQVTSKIGELAGKCISLGFKKHPGDCVCQENIYF